MGFQKKFGDVKAILGGISRGSGSFTSPNGSVLPLAVVDQGDGTGALAVSGSFTAAANVGAQASIVTAQTAVGTTATQVSPVSTLSTQAAIQITNYGATVVYLGGSGVTASNGYPLTPGNSVLWPIGYTIAVYAISGPGNSTIVGTATFS